MTSDLGLSATGFERRKLLRAGGLALAAAPFAVGCAGQPMSPRIFASASLAEAFDALCAAFSAAGRGPEPDLHCAGTPSLVLQLREGARADVLACADEWSMSRTEAFLRPAEPPVRFATNRLCVVTPAGNPTGIASLDDLADPARTLLYCGAEVPAGRYAREALRRAGIERASASDEPSVRAVLQKVILGEADAGIVYRTDADVAGPRVTAVDLPFIGDTLAHYPIAPLHPERGAGFVRFVLSAEGQRILARHGFGPA